MISLLLLVVSSAFAAVSDLRFIGSTSTQMLISFVADDPNNCTIEVSKSNTYSPLLRDVDTAAYGSTADDCARAENSVNGKQVIAVIGKQGAPAVEDRTDGITDSRAAQADTVYYIRVTSGTTATVVARTTNIPLGGSRGEGLIVDPNVPFKYKNVSASPLALSEFNDPHTGALIKRPVTNFGYASATLTTFSDAAGTGWNPTTSTLTAAMTADDSNYVEYSGTTQQPIYFRLDMAVKSPLSSTPEFNGGINFNNVNIKGVTSTGTEAIDLCWVDDVYATTPRCISPLLQANLTGTESTIKFCKDAPCTVADAPGDGMFNEAPPEYFLYPNTRVYNVSGDETNWRFTGSGAQVTCDGLVVGDRLYANDTRSYAIRGVTVQSKSCGSTPPRVTVDLGYDLTHTGTTGITLWRYADYNTNRHIGIRIRKVSSSAATVKINYATWRSARSTPFSFTGGSGGFGKLCQTVPTANNEYLCWMGQQFVGVAYGAEGLILKNYGFGYTNTNFLGLSGILGSIGLLQNWKPGNDVLWSDTVPGRLYVLVQSEINNPATSTTDYRPVIVELNLNIASEKAAGNPDAAGDPGLGNKAQRMDFTTNRIITPCLDNPCNNVNNDYTLYAQVKRYMPSWQPSVFSSFSLQSVQGNLIFFYIRTGSQDSHSMLMALDLGNYQPIGSGYVGTYGNTQHVFAGFIITEAPFCRWCTEHTFQAPLSAGGDKFVVVEGSDKCSFEVTATAALSSCSVAGGGSCNSCPNVTLDGINYNGLNYCGTLDITSSWDGGWGTTPAGFAAGDPVAPSGCNNGAPNVHGWGAKLAVGDFMWSGNEFVRLLQRNSNTQWVVIRGWGGRRDHSVFGPKTHGSSDTWYTRCGARSTDVETANPELPLGIVWYPTFDATGTNSAYTFQSDIQNHAWHGECKAAKPEYNSLLYDPATPSSLAAALGTRNTLREPDRFSGVTTACNGNACEDHPSYSQVRGDANAKSWFADVKVRLFTASTGSTAAALVAGKTYIYKYNGAQSWRHFDLDAYTAISPLRKANTVADSPGDVGKICVSVVADDCFSGSLADSVYFVLESLDTTFIDGSLANSCKEGEFGTIQGDICIHNGNAISAATVQFRLPTGTGETVVNGAMARAVSRYARYPRESATENVKADPLGVALLARNNFYIYPPRFPLTTTVPTTFLSFPVKRSAVPPGTATMHVEFGYNSSYHCNGNRAVKCWAETSALNEATPYKLLGETMTGLSCTSPSAGSPCLVVVPAIANRVLYYSVVYRNGGGTEIYREPRVPTVVN